MRRLVDRVTQIITKTSPIFAMQQPRGWQITGDLCKFLVILINTRGSHLFLDNLRRNLSSGPGVVARGAEETS